MIQGLDTCIPIAYHSPMVNDTQVAIRLSRAVVARVARLTKLLEARPAYAAWRVTPSSVMRHALIRGLDVIEAEAKKGGR